MIRLDIDRFSYAENVIFENASFVFPRDGFTAVTGESGCGKTTLLRLLCSLESGGKVSGIEREEMSVVFQEPRLFPAFTALENAAVTGNAEEAREMLVRIGMGGSLDKKPSELSGGMKSRVAIVRALCSRRPFILLDEPFKALDTRTAADVFTLIREKVPGGVIVTHDLDSVKEHCSSLISLQPDEQ